MKRAYNRNMALPMPHGPLLLALVRFLLRHAASGGYDAEAVYASLFQTYTSQHCTRRRGNSA